MPITARAIKKLSHDRKRTRQNQTIKNAVTKAVKQARKTPTVKKLSIAFQKLDKAVKARIIHPNKGARIKSRLSKLLKKK